jgi:MerR family redox-sensitive transcriptional activator SoxR
MSRARPPALPAELSVGEVAARTGLPVSTIHFYEAQGLVTSRRTSGNQRRFSRGVLRLISIIKVAQRTGIPLAAIGEALNALPTDRNVTAADWKRMSRNWKALLDDRIDTLMRLRDQLERCIGCGCLSLKECPLRNPLDALSKGGSGPRLLDPG